MENFISSRTNPAVIRFASLKEKKGREKEALFLCEGIKLCREALGNVNIEYALLCEDAGKEEAKECAALSGAPIITLSKGAFEKISQDNTPDGIIFICNIPEDNGSIKANERIFILECVRDPGNVGTILRSAAAFGADRVVLIDSADIYNPKVVRASMGALFKIKTSVYTSLSEVLPILKNQGRRILATALTDTSAVLGNTALYENDCPLVGNEGHGASTEAVTTADETMIIPMTGKTESLNASVAASVVLWEYGKIWRK